MEQLSSICSSGVADSEREPLASFLRTTFSEALQRGHGALVAQLTSDGSLLRNPIDLTNAVRQHEKERTPETLDRLLSYASLLEGMLSSDGIVLLTSKGEVGGYNFFVHAPPEEGTPPRNMIGGARRRAFRSLCKSVEKQELIAAFFRSSDGTTEYYGPHNDGL